MAHEHPVLDTDVHFRIDPITRKIQNRSGKAALTKGDHNSERFTFDIPRLGADGHDLSLCNVVEVHYTNTNSEDRSITSKDLYTVKDLHISQDDDSIVVFSWLIHRNATRYAGTLDFSVKFKCVSDGGDGVEEFGWGTPIFTGISVADSIDNNGAVEMEHSDALAALAVRVAELSRKAVKGIKEVELLAENWQKKTDGEWYQMFEFDSITPSSDVEIRIDENAVKILENKTLTFDISNENGVVVIRAIGENKPTHDYTVQIVTQEVTWL